jgi:hypothetical protein
MIKKFVDFFKANKGNPTKLDVNYLSDFIRDLMNNLGDLNGVYCKCIQKAVPSDISDMFEYRYTIRFDLNNINIEEFENEFKSIISHLSSEDLYVLFDDTKIKTVKQVDKILPKDNPTNELHHLRNRYQSLGYDDLWSKALHSIDSEIFWNVDHSITIVHKDYIER